MGCFLALLSVLLGFVFFVQNAHALIPQGIVSLGDHPYASVVIVDKSKNTLEVYTRHQGEIRRELQISTLVGKKPGPKQTEGDHRTPEGIYFLTDFIAQKQLFEQYGKQVAAQYGNGAFVMDYPNPVDRRWT